jgi:hypothetical protein
MVNREYPITPDEASQAAPPHLDTQAPTSSDTEVMATTCTADNPGISLENALDYQQYVILDKLGEWQMHEPTSPWQDGDLVQQRTPNPVNNIPRWQALTEEYRNITIPLAEATDLRKDLWLTSLNCGSLSEANSPTQINKGKLTALCWQFQRCGSDVMYLTDTRLTQLQGIKAIEHIRTLLPHGTFIRQSPVEPQRPTRGPKQRTHWHKGKPAPARAGYRNQAPCHRAEWEA